MFIRGADGIGAQRDGELEAGGGPSGGKLGGRKQGTRTAQMDRMQ